MPDEIIKIAKLSDRTVIFTDVQPDLLGVEIGSGTIFLPMAEIFNFIRALKEVDKYYLGKD
ncbi:MAG: hypothetical protein JRD05_05990 [Deltaproteobacteria bacterium]|nr:hypothetical protein [Deltaproteobacteria bacterium]